MLSLVERTKKCKTCEQVLPWTDYTAESYDADGNVQRVKAHCRVCIATLARERYARQREGRERMNGRQRIPEPWEHLRSRACISCGETKTFARFSPKSYDEDGSVRTVQSRCRECQVLLRSLDVQRAWRARNREMLSARKVAWSRQRRAELKADRAGLDNRLPSEPFRLWLLNRKVEHGEELAQVAGRCHSSVSERTLRRVVNLEQENITLRVVDECLTSLGENVNDLYPLGLAA